MIKKEGNDMTKIDIISGFLGAGKTTLIKKLINEAYTNETIVLIENEFGEIGIDKGFLKESGIEMKEMNSGCICCSLVGDFAQALGKVVAQFAPDRILIEPSGVGKLSDVIKAVEHLADEQLHLNSYTTVVDGNKCKLYMKNFGEFFNNQVEFAKTIIVSRSQLIDEEKLADCVSLLQKQNANASIITTPWDELDGKKILEVMEEGNDLEKQLFNEEEICPHCHHHHEEHEHTHHEGCHHEHHHHHHADEVFTSWGKETIHTYQKEELIQILEALAHTDTYGTILRAKGMLACANKEWLYFDLVPEEYEIRTGSPETIGKFCVIGANLQEDALKELFRIA